MATEEIVEATNGAADDTKEANCVPEQVTQEVSRLAIALAQASFFAEFLLKEITAWCEIGLYLTLLICVSLFLDKEG